VNPAPCPGERQSSPHRLTLDNGLTVIFQKHGAADVAAVQLWVRVGARNETEGEAGLSHFIEHLLFKGTPTGGPGVIDRTISGLGGEMNAATSQDFTYYHVVLPAQHVETALDVVGDAARHASFEPGELGRERLVVLEEIRRSEDNPSASLWRVLLKHHFAGHPYGRPVLGTPDSIKETSRDAIVAYYRRYYAPNNSTIVVAGNLERERTIAHTRTVFAAWEPRPVPGRTVDRPARLASVQRLETQRPLQQTYAGIAWRGPVVPQQDVYVVDLLVSILGRGRSSRLHQALRERGGLVSSVSAGFYSQHDAGTIAVTARTTAAKRREVEGAVLAEIERLRTTLVSEEELARALTAVEAAYAFGHETAEGVAYGYGSAETVWTLDFELTYLDDVRQVTREQIREAAQCYLVPDRFTAAVLAPGNGAH